MGKKFSYLFTMFAESQQCHPLSHFSVSYSFIIQNASNNETADLLGFTLYSVYIYRLMLLFESIFICFICLQCICFPYTQTYIHTHACMHTNTQTCINTHTGIPKNMHAYSRLLFNSKICININICGIHNINEDTCTKRIINNYMNMLCWL